MSTPRETSTVFGSLGSHGGAFGSRHVLYERFFTRDPLTRARTIATIYPKQEVIDRVLDFLGRDDDHL